MVSVESPLVTGGLNQRHKGLGRSGPGFSVAERLRYLAETLGRV